MAHRKRGRHRRGLDRLRSAVEQLAARRFPLGNPRYRVRFLPQKVRIRLLATTQDSPPNTSISVSELARIQTGETGEVRLAVDLKRSEATADTAAITRTLNGIATEFEARVNGQSTRWRHRVEVGDQSGGWGKLELPADGNPRDNVTYYRYSDDHPRPGWSSPRVRLARFAGRPGADASGRKPAKRLAPMISPADLRDITLVIWQAPLPQGDSARLATVRQRRRSPDFLPPRRSYHHAVCRSRLGRKTGGRRRAVQGRPLGRGSGAAGEHGRGTAPALNQLTACSGNECLAKRPCSRRSTTARHCSRVRRLAKGRFISLHPAPAHVVGAGRRHGGRADAPTPARRRQRPVAARLRGRVRQGRRRDLQLEWASVETSQRGDVQHRPASIKPATAGWSSTARRRKVNLNGSRTRRRRIVRRPVVSAFSGKARRHRAAEIWRMFLFFMLLALLVEAWLIRPRPAWSRTNRPKTPTRPAA